LSEDRKNTHLVVGSSAGGIEALSKLVSTLPEGLNAPVVIAQHLHPERESRLPENLGRRSSKGQLETARQREGRIRAEERERFSLLTAASKRFAHSMRSRMDERQRQQRRLHAQYAVSRVLEDSGDLSEAAPEIFRVLGERLGWEVGVLWTVEADALCCGGVWHAGGRAPDVFEEACRGSAFRPGAGLPGRVGRREDACWVEEVLEDAGFLRKEVGLDIAPESIVGSVEDDGRGFDPADDDGGVGLRSMRERAALLDGALRLDCGPGRGTRVEVSVPLAGGR
jgi:hypothetical protein